MIVPNAVRQWYEDSSPYLNDLGQRVRELVAPFCRERHFLYEDRVKSVESLAEKIETGRFSNWEKIDDLFACTIIIPLVTDEPIVMEFLRNSFHQLELRTRNAVRKPADCFRFDSTRFIGRLLRKTQPEIDTARSAYDYSFEIQIKTVFEFAWSRTTHALTYKGDQVSWERQRLAAQLKAATEQLDILVNGFDAISDFMPQGNWPSVTDRITIESFFKRKVAEGAIPSELSPMDWTRFADNVYSLFQAFSGRRSNGSESRPMADLNNFLDAIEKEISVLGAKYMPRSISLLQFVAGVLGSRGAPPQKLDRYYFLLTDDLKSLYPKIDLPCNVFGQPDEQ